MKKPPSKQDIRRQLNSQVDDFLAEGGKIREIPRGISGREDFNGAQRPIHQLFDQPRQPRTPIPEILAALNERQKKHPDKKIVRKKAQPKLKTIYDDFGEPVRKVWVEE